MSHPRNWSRPGDNDAAKLMALALEEGRHSPIEKWRTACQGCGEWVSGIWFVNEQGKRLCRKCAPPDRVRK